LPVRLDDHALFETFHRVGNETAVHHLERVARGEERGAFLSGPAAVGKTHLLQATCALAGDNGFYIDADVLHTHGPDMLDGLERRGLVAIDDVHRLLGDDAWDLALFSLYNRIQDSGSRLVFASDVPRRELSTGLDDLASRLSQLPAFRLSALDDAGRVDALTLRATHRGLELPKETAQYLLSRTRRDMASLYGLLDRLDSEALRAQRRLTVPFVRDVLSVDD